MQIFRVYLLKAAWAFEVWCGKMYNLRRWLVNTSSSFSVGFMFGVNDIRYVLVLRQFIKCFYQNNYRHTFEYLELARSEQNIKKNKTVCSIRSYFFIF